MIWPAHSHTFTYCSQDCKNNVQKRQKPLNKLELYQKQLCTCANCGRQCYRVPSLAKRFKYCSRECKDQARKKSHQELQQKIETHQHNTRQRLNIWLLSKRS